MARSLTPPPKAPLPDAALHSEGFRHTRQARRSALVQDYVELIADLIEDGALDAGLQMFVDSVSMPGIWRKSPPAFRAMAIDNADTLPKQFRDPLPAYTQAAAAGIRCSTLLISGANSPAMYRENVESLAAWITGAEQRTIAGASHGMNVTHAAEFNRLIDAFVSSVAA